MGFQSGITDRARWMQRIQFLQRNRKLEAAQELSDILKLEDEANESGSQSRLLLQWIDELQPVLEAVDAWMNGSCKQMFFTVQWRKYRRQRAEVD
jgi:hypothetical protein